MQYLGQHFLKNKAILEKIADSLDLGKGDVVIEIGPGHGELTEVLGGRVWGLGGRVITIEKDRKLVRELKNKIEIRWKRSKDTVEVIEGDALKILKTLPDTLYPKPYKLAGNIPYYITGHLLRILSELEHKPKTITLLIQQEVAERIVARPPRMNLLAAITQSWAEPKIIARAGKRDFSPPPNVDSAIVTLCPKPHAPASPAGGLNPRFFDFLRILFKQPRKTILNNLSAGEKKEAIVAKIARTGIYPGGRPQNLSLKEMQNLFKALYNSRKQ